MKTDKILLGVFVLILLIFSLNFICACCSKPKHHEDYAPVVYLINTYDYHDDFSAHEDFHEPARTKVVYLKDSYWINHYYDFFDYDYIKEYRNYRYNEWHYPSKPIKDYYYEYVPYMKTVTRKECYHIPPHDSLTYWKCP